MSLRFVKGTAVLRSSTVTVTELNRTCFIAQCSLQHTGGGGTWKAQAKVAAAMPSVPAFSQPGSFRRYGEGVLSRLLGLSFNLIWKKNNYWDFTFPLESRWKWAEETNGQDFQKRRVIWGAQLETSFSKCWTPDL